MLNKGFLVILLFWFFVLCPIASVCLNRGLAYTNDKTDFITEKFRQQIKELELEKASVEQELEQLRRDWMLLEKRKQEQEKGRSIAEEILEKRKKIEVFRKEFIDQQKLARLEELKKHEELKKLELEKQKEAKRVELEIQRLELERQQLELEKQKQAKRLEIEWQRQRQAKQAAEQKAKDLAAKKEAEEKKKQEQQEQLRQKLEELIGIAAEIERKQVDTVREIEIILTIDSLERERKGRYSEDLDSLIKQQINLLDYRNKIEIDFQRNKKNLQELYGTLKN